MGYYSTVRDSNEPVTILIPESVNTIADQAFHEEALSRGYTAPENKGLTTEDLEELLNEYDLSYFLYVSQCENGYVLASSGESGRAYDFEDNAKKFSLAISERQGTITGTLFLEGEEVGDVKRIRFENGDVITDKAVLTFPDGTTYPG